MNSEEISKALDDFDSEFEGSDPDSEYSITSSESESEDQDDQESDVELPPRNATSKSVKRLKVISPESDWTDLVEAPTIIPFEELAGANRMLAENSTPFDYLKLLLSEDIIKIIVEQTNLQAKEMMNKTRPLTRTSRFRHWHETDENEIWKFLGLCILMGLWKLPSLADYWKTTGLFKNSKFPSQMSRNRFEMILRTLHFNANESQPNQEGNRLHKISPILDKLKENFSNMYTPNKEISLDESMAGWRGRLKFRQYNKSKKKRYGIKIYEVCTPDGFLLNFMPYVGQSTVEVTEELSHTEAVVMKLMEPYLNKGYHLYMDNFYNSVKLSQMLLEKNTYVCGTLRKNRKRNPKCLIDQKLKKGFAIWKRNKQVYVTKWKDKKEVTMISTIHPHSMVETRNKRMQIKMKPKCIAEYNKFMGGVDRSDQHCSYYVTPRRTVKWYKKLFFHFIDRTISNAYILFKESLNGNRINSLQFRESIIISMCPGIDKDSQIQRGENNQQHYLSSIKPNDKKKNPSRRCRECANSGSRKESRYECTICEGHPALCIEPCFKLYHNIP